MKILLVRPPRIKQAITLSNFMFSEPLGLEMIYSVFEQNHTVEIFDMMIEKLSIEEKIRDFEPDRVGITSLCIDVSTEMVVGAEGDTLESIRKTKDFIEKNKISVPRFYILTPFPGTRFFEQIEKAGRLVNKDIYSYDGTSAVYKPQNMTPDELTAVYWELYENLFTFKSIIKRNILRREMLKMPHKYLFNTIVNLYYREQIKRRITPNIF